MDTTIEDLERQKAALDETARRNWQNPAFRNQLALELAESIYRGYEAQSMLDQITNVRRVGLGERVWVRELEGLRAFWTARGGRIETSELSENEYEVIPDIVGIAVEEHEDALVTRISETAARLKVEGVKQLDMAVNKRLVDTMRRATPADNSLGNYTSTNAVTLTAVQDAIMEVTDASESGQVTLIGRSTMTHQVMNSLQNSGYFMPNTMEQINQTGVLGTVNGAKLVTLKNVHGGGETAPNNELYVIASDALDVAFFGGMQAKEESDRNWYWHWVAKLNAGFLLHHTDRVQRIVDTTL